MSHTSPNSISSTQADVFFSHLRDLHGMELHLGRSLPAVLDLARDSELREMISMHAFRTGKRAARLRSIFDSHGVDIGPEGCDAVRCLMEAGYSQLETVANPAIRDMMLVAHCQRIHHYGLAGYTVASRLAVSLDLDAETDLLECPEVEHRTAIRRLDAIGSRLFGPKPREEKKNPFAALVS